MNLIEFNRHFPNEEACKEHLKALRERNGIVCPKCGCTHHYWKGYRSQWQCSRCGHRTSQTSVTKSYIFPSEEFLIYASFDLHVLSTPPAFILSQDQTLIL